ncbi:hypothetical protein ADUPG1_012154, partial [Aduncisulcus paluster]
MKHLISQSSAIIDFIVNIVSIHLPVPSVIERFISLFDDFMVVNLSKKYVNLIREIYEHYQKHNPFITVNSLVILCNHARNSFSIDILNTFDLSYLPTLLNQFIATKNQKFISHILSIFQYACDSTAQKHDIIESQFIPIAVTLIDSHSDRFCGVLCEIIWKLSCRSSPADKYRLSKYSLPLLLQLLTQLTHSLEYLIMHPQNHRSSQHLLSPSLSHHGESAAEFERDGRAERIISGSFDRPHHMFQSPSHSQSRDVMDATITTHLGHGKSSLLAQIESCRSILGIMSSLSFGKGKSKLFMIKNGSFETVCACISCIYNALDLNNIDVMEFVDQSAHSMEIDQQREGGIKGKTEQHLVTQQQHQFGTQSKGHVHFRESAASVELYPDGGRQSSICSDIVKAPSDEDEQIRRASCSSDDDSLT